jgi:hypothetical protein
VITSLPRSTSAPTSNPHSGRCQPVPHPPRLRALALFGRRPPQRVDRPSRRHPKTSEVKQRIHGMLFFSLPNFFVRLESPFLRPDPHRPSAVARRGCQGWPSLRYEFTACYFSPYPISLGGYEPTILRTTIKPGAAPVWVRVRIEFDTRQGADSLCSKLVAPVIENDGNF